MSYIRCIPFTQSFDTLGVSYKVPKDFLGIDLLGKIIKVPYGKYDIFALAAEYQNNLDIEASSVKEVYGVVSDFRFLSPEQIAIIDFVSQHYITPIHNALNLYFPKNLKDKIEKKKLESIKLSEYRYRTPSIQLSENQEQIYTDISLSTQKKQLLYGVTGSGKTQIYIKIIQDTISEGKQVLLLIPEIILTSQIAERMKQVFGDDILVLHSGISVAKKSKYWMDIHSQKAQIIIGTRSSLFYPYNNLWYIIIDEEHDRSYISDSAPRYHSREIAEQLSELYDIPLLMWSGTPKIESFYKWLKWEYALHQLLEVYKKEEV